MKILVLATTYPDNNGSVEHYFIHTRNLYYKNNGMDVTVLSLNEKNGYVIDEIPVITLSDFEKSTDTYDCCLSHAPNIRNHYRFLRKHGNEFSRFVFFFHGHEVLRTTIEYPKPYDYTKTSSLLRIWGRDLYDRIKLRIWARYFRSVRDKSDFVFVSDWMLRMFEKYVGIRRRQLRNVHVIYNAVGQAFESISYDADREKEVDFVTIRGTIDGSKYGVDIVSALAESNPSYRFLVIGKGEYFEHHEKPDNLEHRNKNLTHQEIIEALNQSRYALLPTRTDAQGVMACEMATFGIPLVTSSIEVCREVFQDFEGVALIDNQEALKGHVSLSEVVEQIHSPLVKNEKYFSKNTMQKEVDILRSITENKS